MVHPTDAQLSVGCTTSLTRMFHARGCLYFLFIGMVSLASLAGGLAHATDEEDAEQELETLSRELNALDQWVTEAERDRKQQQSELRGLDERVQELTRGMQSSQLLLSEQQAGIIELEAESALLNEEISDQGQALAKLGTSYQRLSGRRYAMLLFELDTARQFDRVIRYTQIVRNVYLERLKDYAARVSNYREILERLNQGVEREQRLQRELTNQHQQLLAQKNSREGYIASLETKMVGQEQRRKELAQAAERIRGLLDNLRARANFGSGADFAQQRGSLPWPVPGRVLHAYGSRRSETNLTWQGVFIATDTQAEIRAVHGGTTIYQDWLNGFGNLMVVAHGNHHMSLYAQADSFYKSANDPVEGGEVIGIAGSSGGAGETGVYFEIRVDGIPQNPRRWLSGGG